MGTGWPNQQCHDTAGIRIFFTFFAPVTLTLKSIPSRYTSCANMNFLRRGFWSYRMLQTYIQTGADWLTDRHEWNYIPRRFAGGQLSPFLTGIAHRRWSPFAVALSQTLTSQWMRVLCIAGYDCMPDDGTLPRRDGQTELTWAIDCIPRLCECSSNWRMVTYPSTNWSWRRVTRLRRKKLATTTPRRHRKAQYRVYR